MLPRKSLARQTTCSTPLGVREGSAFAGGYSRVNVLRCSTPLGVREGSAQRNDRDRHRGMVVLNASRRQRRKRLRSCARRHVLCIIVLNASRRQRRKRLSSRLCLIRRRCVLNASRRQRRKRDARRWTSTHLRYCAQRLSASEKEAPSATNWNTGDYVKCSTPLGVREGSAAGAVGFRSPFLRVLNASRRQRRKRSRAAEGAA